MAKAKPKQTAKSNPDPNSILKELQTAVKGLLFPSETDAPLEPFVWPGGAPDEAAVRANAKIAKDAPVEQWSLADLSKTIPSESRDDFKPLFAVLGKLSGATVFRVGEINIDVYVVGRTPDGQLAGVKTKVVET